MDLFQYQCLSFRCRAVTPMSLPAHKGSTLRGALFAALRSDFCLTPRGDSCTDCRLRQACPVCALLATADEESPRGVEVARPCTVEPPLDRATRLAPGDAFTFGVTLFGEAGGLLPYLVLGARRMAGSGIGNRPLAPGRFAIEAIVARDPVAGEALAIHSAGDAVVRPAPAGATAAIWALAGLTPLTDAVSLDLLTPMRLVSQGRLVKAITFPIFIRRLLRRVSDLARTASGVAPEFDYRALLDRAEHVELQDDCTRWLDLASYSSRQRRATPIGGLTGSLTFRGDLAPFLPWLFLGALTHVGKDATKGNGWYALTWPGGRFPVETASGSAAPQPAGAPLPLLAAGAQSRPFLAGNPILLPSPSGTGSG